MKPTKSRTLIAKTAERLELPYELVEDVVNFYYSVVSRKISQFENTTILLKGLGTLRLSRKKLEKQIIALENNLKGGTEEDFKKLNKYRLTEESLLKKKKALEMCNNYYKDLYEKRVKNLERKKPNIRRDKE